MTNFLKLFFRINLSFYTKLIFICFSLFFYLFKFILREGEVKEDVFKEIFTQKEAVFSRKVSSKKTFTSLSVKVKMEDPDAVIAIYKKASEFEGVIIL